MRSNITIAPDEAQILSRYLIGEKCSTQTEMHYAAAVTKLNASLTDTQQKTWNRMLVFRIYLKLVDGGLVLTNPPSPLRKRIFIMLTLLEASPDHIHYFLPQERSIWYLIPLGFRAGMSAVYGILGVIMAKLMNVR
jgi:hypothetical protein